ncbi:enoyl-CoA hydratase/isomerase family protein [Chelatococcus reniformis]|uniref:Enoyl-CoA hydratase n=1 Tax=Chelatococcus reniformis TaxID=1494448 RepID=A0A916XHC6_9HYPH|nr:enoyl-CoA hydratase-related protein [Chelatococcus reniformis]GGC71925.1 enoyl-CoA hydratase [Chelatococcus reniformis]
MSVDRQTVTVDRSDAVATVRLNRPEHRNGITAAMMTDLYGTLRDLADDETVRVVVLRGTGADFCPGADIKHYASGAGGGGRSSPREFEISVLLHEMPAVTIAAVSGACAGAGLGWACACDLRIASETARFNSAFLDVGVAGDMGGPWTLPRIVGAAKARELYFLPGKFEAAEALRIGLVSRVSPADRFDADVAALAERLGRAAPLAIRAMKANFLAAERLGFSDYIALETEKHGRLFQSEDTKEAFRAFVEKRPAVFRGR